MSHPSAPVSPNDRLRRHTLEIDQDSTKSEIVIGAAALESADSLLADWLAGRTLFVVSTAALRELHGHELAALRRRAASTVELEVPDGEAAKNVEVAGRLWREMLAAGGKRDSRLVTFGGGTVGDLGGFVAGCFLRGIEFAQIPTTLLAQVDAAIGGKTGIDLDDGKNTVGLFHHPAWVLCDTELLSTLPSEELRSGLVEVIKMAALLDPTLFARVESDLERLLAGDAEALAPVVSAAAAAKIDVVRRDPKEGGLRRVLNFGHTLGHAVESALGYRDLRHGEAVAYGMLFAVRLARRHAEGGLAAEFGARLRTLLGRMELPPLPSSLDVEHLWTFMTRDKKATERGLVWVLPATPGGEILGHHRITTDLSRRQVIGELQAFLADPFAE